MARVNRESRPPFDADMMATDVRADSDVRSMLAFQRGDDAAFSSLVEQHSRDLVRYFFAQCGDLALAEDCAQEVWEKLYRSRSEYVPRARFKTFLLRVARNHWIDHYRSRRRRPPSTSLSQSGEESDVTTHPLADRVEGSLPAPSARLEQRELAEVVALAVASLPDEMREAFVLGELQGLPYVEVAELLGVPVGTVKSRMFNAVRRLREILRRAGVEGE